MAAENPLPLISLRLSHSPANPTRALRKVLFGRVVGGGVGRAMFSTPAIGRGGGGRGRGGSHRLEMGLTERRRLHVGLALRGSVSEINVCPRTALVRAESPAVRRSTRYSLRCWWRCGRPMWLANCLRRLVTRLSRSRRDRRAGRRGVLRRHALDRRTQLRRFHRPSPKHRGVPALRLQTTRAVRDIDPFEIQISAVFAYAAKLSAP